MCGRYVLKKKDLEALLARLGVRDPRDFVSRYNIAPTTTVPAVRVRSADGCLEVVGLQWGLIPHWTREPTDGARLANARAEGIATKPSFREPFRRRRCLVPASGFYEWQTIGRQKFPWYFQYRDESPLLLAGLWDHWRAPDGRVIESCSLITTTPNEVVARVHDRMPVILPDEAIAPWLNPSLDDPARLQPLLQPAPGHRLQATPVSPRVNSVRHDDPDCIAPVAPPSAPGKPESDGDQLPLGLG